MTKRTSKEYFINKDSLIKTKYGTLNKNNPEVLYLRSKTKLKATINKKDYKDDLTEICTQFQKYIKDLIKSNIDFDRYICTFETPERGIIYNKPSHLKYEIYLHPNRIENLEYYENKILSLLHKSNNKLKQLCQIYHIEIL